MKEFMA